ncbi:MAG: L,D-transpeptidase [Legionellales bacterium]|nr:L,D-transpeptidase [Legionellales bacterium]
MNWRIHISIEEQVLHLFYQNELVKTYRVSTAKNGAGERYGSEQTPRGWHCIRAKIGKDQPLNMVFVRRRPTGEIFTPALKQQYPSRDWIITRILWLSGLERGKNRLGDVDTMNRKIYIHGSSDEAKLGQPNSHGCIQMNNHELIELFDRVPVYTKVLIE